MNSIKCPSFFQDADFNKYQPYFFRKHPSDDELRDIIIKNSSDSYSEFDTEKGFTHRHWVMRVESNAFGETSPCVVMLTEHLTDKRGKYHVIHFIEKDE